MVHDTPIITRDGILWINMGNMVNRYNLTAENVCVIPVSVSESNSLEL